MANIEKEIYLNTLNEIKLRIVQSQNRAISSVNQEMIILYWEIGKIIAKRQKDEGWGSAVIPKLSQDIKNEFSKIKGFSERNIKRMLRFYKEYKSARDNKKAIMPQAVAQLKKLIFSIPWSHNIVLIEKIKDKLLAEYSLEGIERPIGISEYNLSKALPKELKSALPTIEEIESELEGVKNANYRK
jgi:predicted nuclease of restriction endonuclease-like (RecB) superfamily